MRLTAFLMKVKLPRGNIFAGKHRLVKRVSKTAIATLKKEFELEERNLFFLRHPYLTFEQSKGHGQALGKHEEWINARKNEKNRKFEKNRTLADELIHLKVATDWDFKAGSKN